jgi:hypothetical protein
MTDPILVLYVGPPIALPESADIVWHQTTQPVMDVVWWAPAVAHVVVLAQQDDPIELATQAFCVSLGNAPANGDSTRLAVVVIARPGDVAAVAYALYMGARGYVWESQVGNDLPRVVRQVAAGEAELGPDVATLVSHVIEQRAIALTLNEAVVLLHLAHQEPLPAHMDPAAVAGYTATILVKLADHGVAEFAESLAAGQPPDCTFVD